MTVRTAQSLPRCIGCHRKSTVCTIGNCVTFFAVKMVDWRVF